MWISILIVACTNYSASQQTITGTWVRDENQLIEVYTFSPDGTYSYAQYGTSSRNVPITQRNGEYIITEGGMLRIMMETEERLYTPKLTGNRLELKAPNMQNQDGTTTEGTTYIFTKAANSE
jgi:hypothetical protein